MTEEIKASIFYAPDNVWELLVVSSFLQFRESRGVKGMSGTTLNRRE